MAEEIINFVEEQLENYELCETLGQGSFGKVKLAIHKKTTEKVAIKILDKEKFEDDSDYKSVLKEIEILKKLKHRNIVQIYEVIETNEKIYIIMEYAEGGDFFDLIQRNECLDEKTACYYFHQIISAIEYFHSYNIAHRDLKPENMLLDFRQNLKISDFGLSTIYSKDKLLYTPCGTPNYAPPEMMKGEEYHGLFTDIWSAGVNLYAMLCGFLPFAESNENLLSQHIVKGDFDIPDTLSNEVIDLIKNILNIDPFERYDLEQIKEHPWYKNYITSEYVDPIGFRQELYNFPVDKNILNLISESTEEQERYIDCLVNDQYNHYTTCYFLLVKKQLKEGKQSVSDFESKEFLDFMNDDTNLKEVEISTPQSDLSVIEENEEEKNDLGLKTQGVHEKNEESEFEKMELKQRKRFTLIHATTNKKVKIIILQRFQSFKTKNQNICVTNINEIKSPKKNFKRIQVRKSSNIFFQILDKKAKEILDQNPNNLDIIKLTRVRKSLISTNAKKSIQIQKGGFLSDSMKRQQSPRNSLIPMNLNEIKTNDDKQEFSVIETNLNLGIKKRNKKLINNLPLKELDNGEKTTINENEVLIKNSNDNDIKVEDNKNLNKEKTEISNFPKNNADSLNLQINLSNIISNKALIKEVILKNSASSRNNENFSKLGQFHTINNEGKFNLNSTKNQYKSVNLFKTKMTKSFNHVDKNQTKKKLGFNAIGSFNFSKIQTKKYSLNKNEFKKIVNINKNVKGTLSMRQSKEIKLEQTPRIVEKEKKIINKNPENHKLIKNESVSIIKNLKKNESKHDFSQTSSINSLKSSHLNKSQTQLNFLKKSVSNSTYSLINSEPKNKTPASKFAKIKTNNQFHDYDKKINRIQTKSNKNEIKLIVTPIDPSTILNTNKRMSLVNLISSLHRLKIPFKNKQSHIHCFQNDLKVNLTVNEHQEICYIKTKMIFGSNKTYCNFMSNLLTTIKKI